MHHGGSFRTYMDHKNLKLQEQFEMQALGQAPRSDLFRGVSIHVNGLTVPSHGELKQLMALHGGR
jgi:DNA repair protein REV1